jgi:UDP-N-acetylmuramate dehydrogenase
MMEVKENVALSPLTTFQIGGAAEYLADVKTEDELRGAISYAKERKLRFTILAGGSNVLVPDEGVKGLVIYMTGSNYSFEGDGLTADAGCNLLTLIRGSASKGLGGWEKLSGIPGTIGGAVRGNAGAFGSEIKDVITKIRAIHSETGEARDFANDACDFSYRHSFFKDHSEWIITAVQARLAQQEPESIRASIEETIAERERRHLQNVKAAGSFFMNPVAPAEIVETFEKEKGVKSRESRVPAGWLIEKAGMKGATVGGAIASIQHPNYIVNQGNATARDVIELAEKVKAAVRDMFNITLHEEAAIL